MKKLIILITILVLAGLVLIGGSCKREESKEKIEFGEEVIPTEVIYDPLPEQLWDSYLSEDGVIRRSHTVKVYDNPFSDNPLDKKLIQSPRLLCYSENGEFKDVRPLPFPEGKEIASEKDKHWVMNTSKWGTLVVEENGTVARHYDETGQPIYVFKNPLVVEKGKNPYKIVDDKDVTIKETKNRNEKLNEDERIELSDDAIEVEFYVENNKLYFTKVTEAGLNYPLEAYDDTDTTSTNAKDNYLREELPNNNFGASTKLNITTTATHVKRATYDWDLPAGSDPISSISFFTRLGAATSGVDTVNLHEIHADDRAWTELTSSWNCEVDDNLDGNCDTEWGMAGASYSETIVDGVLMDNLASSSIVMFELSTNAQNPISGLTWGSDLNIMFKYADEYHADSKVTYFLAKEEHPNTAYIQITYTEAVIDEHEFPAMMIK